MITPHWYGGLPLADDSGITIIKGGANVWIGSGVKLTPGNPCSHILPDCISGIAHLFWLFFQPNRMRCIGGRIWERACPRTQKCSRGIGYSRRRPCLFWICAPQFHRYNFPWGRGCRSCCPHRLNAPIGYSCSPDIPYRRGTLRIAPA